ncbi:MAG: acyl-ACP--UDP-N-acetylglucosamine O-acyltransferase, partial [bacterium]|nr:acyl-ACP--UDP-N-acetylglucosamine O-acyltransferase [bacterium]
GSECNIFHGAAIGAVPQDLKFKGEYSTAEIGNRTTIRECVTVNRGTEETGVTKVGSDCLLMAYVHIAHDCTVGNSVILANSVTLAGHIKIDDYAIIGGLVPIHQFVRVGKHTMVGGGYRLHKDVPPYALAAGEPLKFNGLNSVGLRRRGFSSEIRSRIKSVYKTIYREKLSLTEALDKLNAEQETAPEILEIYNFFTGESHRGIIKSIT